MRGRLLPTGGERDGTGFVALLFGTPPLRGMPGMGAAGFALEGWSGGFDIERPGAEPAPDPVVTAMPDRQTCGNKRLAISGLGKCLTLCRRQRSAHHNCRPYRISRDVCEQSINSPGLSRSTQRTVVSDWVSPAEGLAEG